MRKLSARCALLALSLVVSHCTFALSDHPSYCKSNADCGGGRICYDQLCIDGPSALIDGGGAADSGGAGTSAGSGNAGSSGASGAGSGGSGGTNGSDASVGIDAAFTMDAADGSDAAVMDAGLPPGPGEDYSRCTSTSQCLPDLDCVPALGPGIPFGFGGMSCSQTCGGGNACPAPSSGTAQSLCLSGHCGLDCSGGKTCPATMACVSVNNDERCGYL